MATTTTPERETKTGSERPADVAQKIQQLREVYADAPQMARTALENKIRDLGSKILQPQSGAKSAGRIGSRQGVVSELTLILTFAPGGARRLRAVLQATNGTFADADKVGTVHDMRYVFLENDTKLIFATAYDGDWDAYIDDFAVKIPDAMDLVFSAFEGWPGIHNQNATKDWIAAHQFTADGWYVANPNLTVAQTRKLERVGKAVDEALDKIQ